MIDEPYDEEAFKRNMEIINNAPKEVKATRVKHGVCKGKIERYIKGMKVGDRITITNLVKEIDSVYMTVHRNIKKIDQDEFGFEVEIIKNNVTIIKLGEVDNGN